MFARSPIACTHTWTPPAERLECQPLDFGVIHEHEAGVAGIVAVGLVQRGAARAERAVGHQLERADREAAVAEALGPALAIVLPGRFRTTRDGDVVAERELAALDQPAIGGQRVELGAHLVDAGEADSPTVGNALAHRTIELLVGRPRLDRVEQPLCSVHQQPGRLAARIARDEAAVGIGRGALDAGGAQRGRVRPGGVPVDAHERDRMIRRNPIERGPGRKARAGPQILVPVAPADPLATRHSRGALTHAPRGRLLGLGAPQIERETNTRQVHQVPMRIHEAGHRGAPAEVDDLFVPVTTPLRGRRG